MLFWDVENAYFLIDWNAFFCLAINSQLVTTRCDDPVVHNGNIEPRVVPPESFPDSRQRVPVPSRNNLSFPYFHASIYLTIILEFQATFFQKKKAPAHVRAEAFKLIVAAFYSPSASRHKYH